MEYRKKRKRYLSFIVRLHHLSTPDNETIVTKVKETTAIGTKLLTLSQPQRALSDSYYSLIKNNPSFEIDEKTGSVYLARRLDYNNASIVQMKIQKQNFNAANKKEMTLIFELDDANNHSPKFSTNNYTFNVLENTVIGINIGKVEAFDDDEGTNGIIKYRILGENKDFSIDIKTGEIFLHKTLHYHVVIN
uniref:Cadherin domain-containing protein n=1 Tax=Panagrolaimus superbus TaxID=310955 RepID=A0A914XVF4_9BILA